ncbi:MAG: hypothetical protein M9929_16685 [Burkholderiaceae bacterium]|nr:hypothetical protein [Burkholderiaceae bacterium]
MHSRAAPAAVGGWVGEVVEVAGAHPHDAPREQLSGAHANERNILQQRVATTAAAAPARHQAAQP